MQTFLLLRNRELTVEELKRLSGFCYPIEKGHPVIARADVLMSKSELISFAVHLARAIPDAEVVFHDNRIAPTGIAIEREEFIEARMPSYSWNDDDTVDVDMEEIEEIEEREKIEPAIASSSNALAVPNRSIFDRLDDVLDEDEQFEPEPEFWWDFLHLGQSDVALSMLKDHQLTVEDQAKAKEFLNSYQLYYFMKISVIFLLIIIQSYLEQISLDRDLVLVLK